MKELIQQVLSGEVESISLPMMPISKIQDIFRELGMEDAKEYDTNGFQCDFWDYWLMNDKKYCLSGSLHYGNFNFSLES